MALKRTRHPLCTPWSDAQDWFRVCARCHAPSLRPMAILCAACLDGLLCFRSSQAQHADPLYGFPVRSFLLWTPASDSFIRPLVYALKGGRQRRAFVFLAQEFSLHLSESSFRTCGAHAFVPPPRKKERLDHASCWAHALSAIWGWPVYDLLEPAGPRGQTEQQKALGFSARARRRFASRAALTESIIFTDDVIASGSTAHAAFEALGRPSGFEAWALIFRPWLAGLT